MKLGGLAAGLGRLGDADDPAIWVHPDDPALSLVIAALKKRGLGVYGLDRRRLQAQPGPVRYNNVDLAYRFPLGGWETDLAVVSDRKSDRVAMFAIDPGRRTLTDVTAPDNPMVFTPAGEQSDGEQAAYVPHGLLVVQDGANGWLPRITNFKFVPWERVARAFAPDPLLIDTGRYDPGRR